MVDLDIPVDTDPHTLLHWMQTDLTPATTATALATGDGTTASVFELQNTKNTPALADYVSPAPPAKNPLSHRYVQLLVDTSNLTEEGFEALKNATSERVGFDVAVALAAAGLSDRDVVAANSYNVTNPGPVQADELKRGMPEMRRMVVRAPEHWDAEWKVRRQEQQQQQQATKTGESNQLPQTVVKANSTVAVGVFERNGTLIVGVFPGNKSLPSNGTAPTTVPVVGSAPPTLPSAAGWTTGVVCCILGLMFSL